MSEQQQLAEDSGEDPPERLYDEDGTVVAALGTLDTILIKCWLHIEGQRVQKDVPASALPHQLEIIDDNGCVERRLGDSYIAWDLAKSKATEELWWRLQPVADEECEVCEIRLTAEMIEDSGDFEDCERFPRSHWFEDLSPCPYNKWGATTTGVTYVVFPDR